MNARQQALFAIFLGPAACASDLIVSYVLVDFAAARGSNLILHVVTILGSAVAVLGLSLSYRALRRRGSRSEATEVDRFLALSGIGINAFFLVVIIVGFGLPKLLLHPTD